MNRNLKKLVSILCTLIIVLLSSCSVNNEVPYIIGDCYITIGEKTGFWKYCGMTLEFYNKSNKSINSLEINGNVYLENNAESFVNNRINQNYEKISNPHESIMLRISLDDYLSGMPKNTMKVDQFYVKKIVFADGKSWSDPFGTYAQCVGVKNE